MFESVNFMERFKAFFHRGFQMPKQKTHRGAAKRFKVTSKGKVKRWKAGRRHLLECKTTKQLRNLRNGAMCAPEDAKKIRKLLCVD